MEIDRLVLTVNEVALALSISPYTVRRMIVDGRLRATRFSRRVLVEPAEVERMVKAGREREYHQRKRVAV